MAKKKADTVKKSRAKKGQGMVRQRADKTYEARFTVGRDAGTGKPIKKSVYGKTQADVVKRMTEALAAVNNGTYVEPTKMTLGAWLDIWVKDYLGGIRELTRKSYVVNIENHIKPKLGAVRLDQLDAHTVQGFYNDLSESGRIMQKGQTKEKPPGLSPKTVKNIHGTLHKALNQALLLKYINYNPTDAAVLPRIEKKEMNYLQGKEIADFMAACESHDHGILFMFTALTGLRRGEALGVTWNAVDRDNGTIYIDKQLQRGEDGKLDFAPPKNDEKRHITPPPTVFQLLKRQKAKQGEKQIKNRELWNNDKGLVFTNETGGGLDGDAVYKNYKRFLKSHGFNEGLRLHDLRHTGATLMLESGMTILEVSKELGHADPGFTMKVYGHVTENAKKEAAQKREAQIKAIMG
jgi:integrase